jgi:hypothetical protein
MARCRPLTSILQECLGVLEVIALYDASERLRRRQRRSVPRIHVADFPFRDRHERFLMDAILPWEVPRVNTAAEDRSLEAGLAVEGDDSALGERSLGGPQFFHSSYLGVRNIPNAKQPLQGGCAQRQYDHVHNDQNNQVRHMPTPIDGYCSGDLLSNASKFTEKGRFD